MRVQGLGYGMALVARGVRRVLEESDQALDEAL